MKTSAALLCVLIGVTGAAYAQEVPRFSVAAGAGFTTPLGSSANNVDTGWNVRGGVGLNFSPHVGAMLDLGYDSLGINSGVLNNLGFGGGNVNIFSVTLDPIVHLTPKSRFDIYLTGGGGYYRWKQEFTQPTVDFETGFDPFFGFYPVAVPANVVVSSYSVNKPGIDAGMGISLGSKWGGRFFAEARYNRIFLGNFHMDYVPVTFGFRR